MRAHGPAAGVTAAALDQQDRFTRGHPAGDPGELARIAERLEIQGDHVGARVVLPVFEQVVAADVGLVADRDERGDLQPVQQRGGHGARLRHQRHPALDGSVRQEAGVQPGPGVDHAQAVRADEPHPGRTADLQQLRLRVAPPGLGEPRRQDYEPGHARVRAVAGHGRHVPGGHRHDGQIHPAGHLVVAGQAGHLGGLGVDRMDRPGEAPVDQVAQHLVPDGACVAGGADDRHRARGEHAGEGGAPGFVVAGLDDLPQPGRRLGGDGDVQRAALVALGDVQAEIAQHPQHRAVLGQHVGHQLAHAVLGRVEGDVLQQQRAEPVAVHGVVDEDGQVGAAAVDRDVLRDRDQPLAHDGDERVAVVGGAGDAVHVGVGGAPAAGEEAQVGRALRRAVHQLVQRVAIVGTQRADMGHAAVAQQYVVSLRHGAAPVRGRRRRARPARRPAHCLVRTTLSAPVATGSENVR